VVHEITREEGEMNEKKYFINDEPASANDIIELAKELDCQFADSHFYRTSVAAKILRDKGYSIR